MCFLSVLLLTSVFLFAAVVEDYRLTSTTFVDVVCANHPACIYAENY